MSQRDQLVELVYSDMEAAIVTLVREHHLSAGKYRPDCNLL